MKKTRISMLFTLLAIFAALTSAQTQTELDNLTCLARGFNSSKLLCSTCKDMVEFGLKDTEIFSDCLKCCKEAFGQSGKVKYTSAILEAFVNGEKPAKFRTLTIRYPKGQSPILKLIQDNEVVKTLNIDKWSTDAVEEFLIEHLL